MPNLDSQNLLIKRSQPSETCFTDIQGPRLDKQGGFVYKDVSMLPEKASPPRVPKFFNAIILLLAIGAGNSLFPSSGTELKKEYGRYVHRTWTTENGLPQNTIYALAQTGDGYLWIGSEGGLARFDGFDFTVFNRSNTRALMKNSVTSLCPDRDGSLWIGTFGGGLLHYRDGRFSRIDGLGSGLIWSLRQDGAGNLWVVTTDNGIYYLEQGKSPSLVIVDGIPENRITAISGDGGDNIWIGTRAGLVAIKKGKKKLYTSHNGLAGDYVYCLFADRRKNLWAGTTAGLSRINEKGIRNFYKADGLADNLIRSIGEDMPGRLWIGTEKGVTVMDQGDATVCATPNNLTGDSVMAICRDRENNMWVGTSAGGLNFLKKNEVRVFSTEDGLSGQHIQSICEDSLGGIWVGTLDHGLNLFSQGQWRSLAMGNGLKNDTITSLLADRHGRLWIGTRAAGLQCLEQGKFTSFRQKDGPAGDAVSSLFIDREGNLWMGSDGGGLNRFRDGDWQHYGLASGLKTKTITAVSEDRQGNLWAGSSGDGVHVLRKGVWRQYTTADGLAGDTVFTIHIDESNNIWLGTNGGLNRFSQGSFFNFREWPGPLNNTIFQILADDHGYFWMSTPTGIFCVKKAELEGSAAEKPNDVHCRRFTAMAGMNSTVCSGGFQPAGCKSRDGRLWFPTQKGLVMIDPKTLESSPPLPGVWIEKVQANGRSIGLTGANRFPAATDRFDFSYTAIGFADPQQIEFSTRMEGYESRWSKPGRQRSRHFADLPPGRYLFRVKARGQAGLWNESSARFSFMIRPAFQQTAWFYLLLLAGAAAASAATLFYRQAWARRQKLDKYKLSTLGADKKQEYLLHLKKAMEHDKAYLDPDLTLAKLAAVAAIPAKHVSQLINEQYELNFNDFINRYRVDEAKRKLLHPAAKEFKLLRIAFEVGFNSKSVFNSAFKKNTGLSPSEFRRLLGDNKMRGSS